MLCATDLSVAFGAQHVLTHVSINIPVGAIVGILGPNGSGKTTLLRILDGTLTPDQGHVTLDGHNQRSFDRRAIARRVAVVPQDTHLAFDYTVLEVVLMGRYPHLRAFEVEGPADLAAARDALKATGTLELAHRAYQTLSGGEKQRVIIAAALAQLDQRTMADAGSALLLLDEPTASLDLRYQVEVAALIGRLHERAVNDGAPLTVVLSTHDLHFASHICHTLVLLAEGKIVAQGAPGDVLTVETLSTVYGISQELAAPVLARIQMGPQR
ncbi:MAG: ABC transporter ATP-binding protein [Acidobacteria bacterium]|mgnify:CR=1 FL=1|jgi:iron complex transport system ATP-binding protein|nr:ABC transporter ATP-binding protein [Acidobacteriota bacterium]